MKIRQLLLLLIIGCTPSKVELNTDREKLNSVVVDLYYAEAALKDLDISIKDSLSLIYRQQIAEIHSVDMDLIEKDLITLQKDAEVYQNFHQAVEDSVAVKLKRIEKEKIKRSAIQKKQIDKNKESTKASKKQK